jgi:glutathione peroxidase
MAILNSEGYFLMDANVYSYVVKDSAGSNYPLSTRKGHVTLIVNVASKCGFTPQYKALEALYEKYKDKGFVILGFPCNQFKEQEPGTNAEIQKFCKLNYGVTFPVLSKIDVNGQGEDPLYTYLKSAAKGPLGIEAIQWNFTKFLIGSDGKVIARYEPPIKPESIDSDIAKALSDSK